LNSINNYDLKLYSDTKNDPFKVENFLSKSSIALENSGYKENLKQKTLQKSSEKNMENPLLNDSHFTFQQMEDNDISIKLYQEVEEYQNQLLLLKEAEEL
jgi:hypothetical protein